MAPLGPLFEFSYHNSASSLEPALGAPSISLEYLATACDIGAAYDRYLVRIRKKWRQITSPKYELDQVQKRINELLFPVDLNMREAHGFVARRSILTNATTHVGAAHLQKFDIKDFFASVTTRQVIESLSAAGFGVEASRLLGRLVSCEGSLPLGARTSPRISNLVLASFDDDMSSLASDRGLRYSRYADDLSFSSDAQFDVSDDVATVLGTHGFSLNAAKTRLFKRGQPMFVTGLAVSDSERPRLRKRLKAQLRADFYFVNKYGATEHEERTGRRAAKIMGQFLYARSIEPDYAANLRMRYPNAHRALIPVRADDRIERARRVQRDFVDAVRRAAPVSLPFYVPSVAIGTTP